MDESLFNRLEVFYKNFEDKIKELGLERKDCGGCTFCCAAPPFLMTTSDLEYEYLVRYLKSVNYNIDFHFEILDGQKSDKRLEDPNLSLCPLNKIGVGCAGHPARPFACRIFGPLSQEKINIDVCVYKNPRIYKTPLGIPLWDEYASILKSYPFKTGYIYS